jgi:EamA domain-containing membrane protein RarD
LHCNVLLTKIWIVYALYGRSRKIALVLGTSIVIECLLMIPFAVLSYQHIEFNDVCVSVKISPRLLDIGFVPFALTMSVADHHLQNPSHSL